MTSVYGTLRAGKLILYDSAITVSDLSLADLRITDLDVNGTNRLRTADVRVTFDFHHAYSDQSQLFEEIVSPQGSTTLAESYMTLSVNGAMGRVVRQSYRYLPINPGGTKLTAVGAVLSTSYPSQPSGICSRIGLFDDSADKVVDIQGNGFFFQLNGGAFGVGYRTSTNGTAQADSVVPQSNFSDDKVDGSGKSGFVFNPYVTQTYIIDMTWFGSGLVRLGFLHGKKIVFCHTFSFPHINVSFCQSPALPVRFEIRNTTASGQTDALRVFSGVTWSEGASGRPRRLLSSNTGTTLIPCTSRRPVISLRLSDQGNRACLYLRRLDVLSDHECLWEIYLGGTLGNSSFVSPSGHISQVDTSSTTISGGALLHSFYGKGCMPATDLELPPVTSNIAGESFVLTICASPISQPVSVLASLVWEEM